MSERRPAGGALADAPLDEVDGAILAATARAFQALDPMPSGLIERITFGITLDALEAEIAELERTGCLAGQRSDAASGVQTVTFTSSTMTTTVTITPRSADRVRIDGWVAFGAGVHVQLQGDEQVLDAVADRDGRFSFAEVRRGLARFVLRSPDDQVRPVITPSLKV